MPIFRRADFVIASSVAGNKCSMKRNDVSAFANMLLEFCSDS